VIVVGIAEVAGDRTFEDAVIYWHGFDFPS
jgi:hypothetical protein